MPNKRTLIHNSDSEAKLALRADVGERTGDGFVFVPYAGFGEMATGAGYPLERVIGCDTDGAAVDHWSEHLAAAEVLQCDATKFEQWPDGLITVIDADAYGAPWAVIEHALLNGPVADKVLLLATDGSNQTRRRSKRPYNFEHHTFEAVHSTDASEQLNDMKSHVSHWLSRIGWRVNDCEQIRRGIMDYWRFDLVRAGAKRKLKPNNQIAELTDSEGGLDDFQIHIDKTEQIESTTIRVSAICELFGITRNQYESCVKQELIVRDDRRSPLLLDSIRNYVRHLQRAEETTQANLDRIRAQVEFTRQRQKNELLTTEEREGRLIPLAEAEAEARYLGVLTRQFCDNVISEAVKRVPAKHRVKLRGELSQILTDMLLNHADAAEPSEN